MPIALPTANKHTTRNAKNRRTRRIIKTINITHLTSNIMNLGIWEILLIALIVLLIFGGKKIPELMRGLGKGIRSFKDGMNGKEDIEDKKKSDEQ